MSNELEQSIENAQRITLGQVDNGTLATAVTCAESLAIVRHGRVESYVVPKHLVDDLLMKVAVLECDKGLFQGVAEMDGDSALDMIEKMQVSGHR